MITAIFFIALFVVLQLLGQRDARYQKRQDYAADCPPPEVSPHEIVVYGWKFQIGDDEMHRMLSKRFTYYIPLDPALQQAFRKRLQKFIRDKVFIIKDYQGYREMPVLVSAAAIQLTFGFKEYLLPFYRYIRIFPQEYLRSNSFSVLEGNVQGNIITVAWNHFLDDYANYADGSNVGLHEMSHALYTQKMVIEKGYTKDFSSIYTVLLDHCKVAAELEKEGTKNLYSDYADKDLQEFWAESIELFFEKPDQLRELYPELYESIKLLLNQEPTNASAPIELSNLSFIEKVRQYLLGGK